MAQEPRRPSLNHLPVIVNLLARSNHRRELVRGVWETVAPFGPIRGFTSNGSAVPWSHDYGFADDVAVYFTSRHRIPLSHVGDQRTSPACGDKLLRAVVGCVLAGEDSQEPVQGRRSAWLLSRNGCD